MPLVGKAAGDDLVAGDGSIQVVAGGDDRAKVVAHDDVVQLVNGVAVDIGVFEDFIVIVGGRHEIKEIAARATANRRFIFFL